MSSAVPVRVRLSVETSVVGLLAGIVVRMIWPAADDVMLTRLFGSTTTA